MIEIKKIPKLHNKTSKQLHKLFMSLFFLFLFSFSFSRFHRDAYMPQSAQGNSRTFRSSPEHESANTKLWREIVNISKRDAQCGSEQLVIDIGFYTAHANNC